jgi:atlastin
MSGNGDFDDETIYGKPVQVIAIDEQENTFSLNEENLNLILSRVPPKMKLSIVSVVGAFRTGKSFLLDFFLKYLRYPQNKMGEEAWNNLFTSKTKLDGNSNLNENNNNNIHPDNFNEKETNNGFSWKSGTERNTLGIWFWSIPFIRKLKSTGESVAVLIVDTQGIFDSRLTQMMATSIFGLSTLLSSHQIYNVQNRLQEDHLQHLALFTEYGRATLKIQGINDEEEKKKCFVRC